MTPPIPGPHEGLNAAVAAQLRAERAAQNMTVQDLADASEVPFATLRRYLTAERHIDVTVLAALAEALRTTPAEIVQAAEARRAKPGADLPTLGEVRKQKAQPAVVAERAARPSRRNSDK